jgi:hypothetical protein
MLPSSRVLIWNSTVLRNAWTSGISQMSGKTSTGISNPKSLVLIYSSSAVSSNMVRKREAAVVMRSCIIGMRRYQLESIIPNGDRYATYLIGGWAPDGIRIIKTPKGYTDDPCRPFSSSCHRVEGMTPISNDRVCSMLTILARLRRATGMLLYKHQGKQGQTRLNTTVGTTRARG